MNRILSSALLALLAYAMADPVAAQEAEQEHAPVITCDEPVYDFGKASTGSTVEHTYVIRNAGDLTLLIGNVRTSCGCTLANITTKEVPPGEQAEVTARLSLKNRRGRQRKAITVESNDPKTPRLVLYLEGDATSQVSVEPSKLYLGQIEEDVAATGTINISADSDDPLQITKVESHSEFIAAELETVEEGRQYRLHVATKPPLPAGPVHGNIRLSTDSDVVPVIDVSVSGTVLDVLTVAPNQIVLAEKADPVTRYVVVRPGKTKVFSLGAVTAPTPDITVNVTELGSNGYQIRLDNVVASKELDGQELLITTDAEGKGEIRIPFKIISPS